MTLDASLSNIIIEDNVFDYGNFAADTGIFTVPTTYGYGTCIYTTADATIINNYISGAISGCTPILTIGAISCNISKNTFIRNSVPINCYINASASSGDQIITENIFDSPTVDGTNDTLVQLRTIYPGGPVIVYERNKNQTAIKQIQKCPYLTSLTNPTGINTSQWARYTDSSSTISVSNPLLNHPFTSTFFKQEGIAVNYSIPFAYSSGIIVPGTFVGFTTLSGQPPLPIDAGTTRLTLSPGPGATSSFPSSGWLVFGNDSGYYHYTASAGTVTLDTPYAGPSINTPANAIYFPDGAPLSTTLFGTFTTTSGTGVTASANQNQALTTGSQIYFNDNSGTIYTVATVSGTAITLTTSYSGAPGTYSGATTGSNYIFANFSINLSEVLPENVQVISTVFGTWGNNNIDPSGGSNNLKPLIYADYNAFLTTTDGSAPYSNNISSLTFSVVNNNNTITASATPAGISIGTGICFANQSDAVYTITNITGTTITLSTVFGGTTSASVTAVTFNSTMADVSNYSIASGTNGPFGSTIGILIGSGGISKSIFGANTQYVKIDPSDTLVSNGFPYFTGSGMLLRYNLNITLNIATLGNAFYPESPLIIKYRW